MTLRPLTKRLPLVCIALGILAACSKAPESATPPAQGGKVGQMHSIEWMKPNDSSVEAIFDKAKTEGKPVFLYWGAVWCPPCNQIKATVFSRPDFIERSKAFIPVYLDGDTPGAQKLGTQFKVRGYPTTILFKPDGTEITRLPGEVDAVLYMQVLRLALNASQPIHETLAAALNVSTASPPLTPDAWRMLAYYSWETDQAQLVDKKDLAATVLQLAAKVPVEHKQASARLKLTSVVMALQEKFKALDKARALVDIQKILADGALAHENADLLANYAGDIVGGLTDAGTATRLGLVAAWSLTLDRLALDTTLSKADQLAAVQGKVVLAQLGHEKDAKAPVDVALQTMARVAATKADNAIDDKYERQAVIPSAAHLLSEVGLLDESDAMLMAELPKAVSPYYHMLVLASNAKKRGDKAASLDWSEKAYSTAIGPATRLQWGSGYVAKLIELSPEDSARIGKAASQIIAELDPAPETFYERNRRSLEKMGALLLAWNEKSQHTKTLRVLSGQLAGVCKKLPEKDPSREACEGVFTKSPKKT